MRLHSLSIDCARGEEEEKKNTTRQTITNINANTRKIQSSLPYMKNIQKTMAHRRHQHHRHHHHHHRHFVQYANIGVCNGILLGFIAFTALSTISSGKCQSDIHKLAHSDLSACYQSYTYIGRNENKKQHTEKRTPTNWLAYGFIALPVCV